MEERAPIVVLGGRTVTLVRPRPLVAVELARTKAEIEALSGGEWWAWLVAHLIETWPQDSAWPGPRPSRWKIGRSAVQDGALAFDTLIQAGILLGELAEAGNAAQRWVAACTPQVGAARDFSAAPEGGTSETPSGYAGSTVSP